MSSLARGVRLARLSRWTRSPGLFVFLIVMLFVGGYAAGQIASGAASESRFQLARQAVPLAGGVGLVTPEQVVLADPETYQLVDVRGRDAFEQERATGALSMPESETVELVGTLPTDRTLVLYCSCPDEKTSLRSARTLAGVFKVSNLVVLKGGLEAYIVAGGAVTGAAGHSAVEHQGCGCDTNAPAFKLYAGNLAAERERQRAAAEQE